MLCNNYTTCECCWLAQQEACCARQRFYEVQGHGYHPIKLVVSTPTFMQWPLEHSLHGSCPNKVHRSLACKIHMVVTVGRDDRQLISPLLSSWTTFNKRINDWPRSLYIVAPAHSTRSAAVCWSVESFCELSWSCPRSWGYVYDYSYPVPLRPDISHPPGWGGGPKGGVAPAISFLTIFCKLWIMNSSGSLRNSESRM